MTWRFECHEAVASTSDLCRDRAAAGAASHLAVLARRQTKGRGTRGREWADPGGSLAFSFLLRFPKRDPLLNVLPFIVGLSVFEAFRDFGPDNRRDFFQLKWPNDLLLYDRKMAGVLIETGEGEDDAWAVTGVGANLVKAPEIPGRQLAAFSELGNPPTPHSAAASIVRQVDLWVKIWRENGFSLIRQAWLERAHPIGRPLAVQGRGAYMSGMFAGLDEQGRLLLELQSGEIATIVAGDVLLG